MPRLDAPGPLRRRGPRPLMLHLTLAMMKSDACGSMSPSLNDVWGTWTKLLGSMTAPQGPPSPPGWPPSAPDLAHTDFAGLFGNLPLPQVDPALIAGIAAYRRHPWERTMADPPCRWAEGETRLLDFGAPDGQPVLIIPSLINRAYVLDLAPGHSMVRWLAERGMRPLLLDWGWPGEAERSFNLTDYVTGRLDRALLAAHALCDRRKLTIAGYCMGGLLAVALVQRHQELVERLALLATPWDFHAADPQAALQVGAALPFLEPTMSQSGTLSVDALQSLFTLLDPGGIGRKYRAFGRLPQADEAAQQFVALEDWLNDGVPLAAPVARECLGGWYGRNTPAAGSWRIAGLPVTPAELRLPSLVVVPERDRIVPPESALPLARIIPGAVLHVPHAGHVGMVAGAHARSALWQPILEWMKAGGGAS